jgi:hypothetical protein
MACGVANGAISTNIVSYLAQIHKSRMLPLRLGSRGARFSCLLVLTYVLLVGLLISAVRTFITQATRDIKCIS